MDRHRSPRSILLPAVRRLGLGALVVFGVLAGLGLGGGAAAAPPASASAVPALRDFLGSRFGYLPTRVAEGVVVTRVERVYEDRLRVHLEDGRSYELTVVEWGR